VSDNNFTVATTTTKIYTNGKNYNKKDRGFVVWGGHIWAIQGWIFGKRRTLLWYAGTYEEQPTIAISEGECGNEAVAISDGECGKEAEIRERKGIARGRCRRPISGKREYDGEKGFVVWRGQSWAKLEWRCEG
jgi:hypothetical protein